jgi:hypothetical protein
MVIGEEMVTGTLVPDVLVKLMALIVTAHSSTPSAGESPMFTRTLVDWGYVGGVPLMGLEPLLHPTAPVMARVSASIALPIQVAVRDDFMVIGCLLDVFGWSSWLKRGRCMWGGGEGHTVNLPYG